MYSAVLVVHILGAILTGVVALLALFAMIRSHEAWYGTLARTLAYLATFEVLTGTLLAVLSLEISVASVCGNVAIYLATVASVEVLLYMRMQRFPFAQTLSPVAVSVGALLTGLVLGF